MPRILILYATVEGHTGRVAERIAARLREGGATVDVRQAGPGAVPDGHDAVIVGASVHYGQHPAWLANLDVSPTAFFSVSLGAKQHYATRFLRKAGWQPQLTAVFAGALQYSKYGPIKRLVVRGFALVGGHDTDPSRDYEYTDWQAVDSFASAFARLNP